MRSKLLPGLLLAALSVGAVGAAGPAVAAAGAGGGPASSWNDMQKFEYYLGDIAGALNVCRMYGLHSEMLELANLTPYGKKGFQSWAAYDDIRGAVCGRVRKDAERVLEDKSKLFDYLKAKYRCVGGDCVER